MMMMIIIITMKCFSIKECHPRVYHQDTPLHRHHHHYPSHHHHNVITIIIIKYLHDKALRNILESFAYLSNLERIT